MLMPHMANLTWILLFLTFSVTCVMAFMTIKLTKINMFFVKNKNLNNNKKWQW